MIGAKGLMTLEGQSSYVRSPGLLGANQGLVYRSTNKGGVGGGDCSPFFLP